MGEAAKLLDEIEFENFEIVSDIDEKTVAILEQAEKEIANGTMKWMSVDEAFARLDKKYGWNVRN